MINSLTLVVENICQLPSLQRLVLYFLAVGVTFGLLERLFPASRRGVLRPSMGIDIFYWFFTPVVVKMITSIILVLVVGFVFYVLSWPLTEESLRGFGPISEQPAWLQVIEMLVLADLIGYWMHRWFHVTWLWRFHAVHHSPKHLDWLSAYRMHPLNDAASRVIQTLPLLLIGFSPLLLVEYVPFIVVYVVFLHTNIRWTFGPLKYVIASPSFHRWHHASEEAALDRNYATMFPIWDLLFGTYFLPDRQPEKYGVKDNSVPESFLGQMLHPFIWKGPAPKMTDGQ